jgi:cation diffusion facilitator family transporter
MPAIAHGLKASGVSVLSSILLAAAKIATGVVGNSYALIADGMESVTDVVSAMAVWSGLRIAAKPPDKTHPYGHGKAESLAAVFVCLVMLAAAVLIAVMSIHDIRHDRESPAWYTLVVLGLVIIVKETLYRYIFHTGSQLSSTALQNDAWHHRLDAITSAAAFVGIAIALIGGPGYESADGWAALATCGVVMYNGIRLLGPSLREVMDAAVTGETELEVRRVAGAVRGVHDVEKCRIRKSGLGLLLDIHVTVDGEITVRVGHEIARLVKHALIGAGLSIHDVIVHIEPHDLDKG